ncbi:hypothetical protein [Clostridium gasigenes]|uniref:Uncharacterized protein n=1 Tax=Clostridium gasigenes TaxID=94869 RepID=A0A1H0NEH6_9CLOT|nr:hypothetical protein [Clostridium gasigenes]MBB6623927.1 hypothetical protein [Clostridium gasigenes]MBU3103093.1 hypothetical protein [Clostridium gasigenes]MBU3131686.1 hypothetical protein [Clostridium gasigenes]MBU3135158.1 hypothetical protein [Clostridium gasigenes]SDO91122.1 hypothetical protein SAMN04488529_101804 [Clostridium gasigenes]
MKKNILLVILIASLNFQQYSTLTFNSTTLNNPIEGNLIYYINKTNIERPHDKEKIESFWNSENESFLSSEEKEKLNVLKCKVERGENLTVEERQILSELRSDTIRKKLGDARFERYKKLIEKREKQAKGQLEIELSKEEKTEIYNFEKEIKGK